MRQDNHLAMFPEEIPRKLIKMFSFPGENVLEPFLGSSASAFLRKKTKGKKAFLKFDTIKYDENNNLMAYLYLENRTFLNAHLLTNGLALVGDSIDFKYKEKI